MDQNFDRAISPLLDLSDVPAFDQITADSVEPALNRALTYGRETIANVLQDNQPTDFEHVVAPLEIMGHRLERVWAPVSHLNAVKNSDDLRDVYNRCLEKLTQYWSEVGQNQELYKAYLKIRDEQHNLDPAQQRLLDLAVINFELEGVGLADEQRREYADIKIELSALQSKFEENVLDCSNAWSFHTEDKSRLGGIPENALNRAAGEAVQRKLDGWCFTLDFPTYNAVMSHASDSTLRKLFHDAWVTRASTAGDHDPKYDNTPVIEQILPLRQQAAELLGYADYAEYSLARKMAESGSEVEAFLRDLAARSKNAALRELADLENLAGTRLQPWDISYYSERLREARFEISDELLRPYFPLEKALAGLFSIAERIFAISIREIPPVHAWHDDVRMYQIDGPDGQRAGRFYTDLFARQKKRGGAWMGECVGHNRLDNPGGAAVAFLVCNFMPADADKPALLTHDEIVTLFHEFGHTLHMLLSKVPYPGVAGINGVPWDAVELPSQFMENFAWQKETLPLISGHYESGEPIPGDMVDRLLGSRTFNAGLQSLRQIEFALFDMRIHREHKSGVSFTTILDDVRKEIAVIPGAANNRFANAFSHVFAGGYAAGYYSYKWAEVLSADAFSAFEETAILDDDTGNRFRSSVLERGGAVDAMTAFTEFRGRAPTIDALVRHNGLNQP
ncbi:MAG: M3 family metallopeptidase [Gammaproteobacteria bacterium]|nr:M3 family metallopeptidase [Gammaproteobacteria bacterium]